MKDTHSNREALAQMVEACEGTRYQMRIRELKNLEGRDIMPMLTRRENAPEYTPAVYPKTLCSATCTQTTCLTGKIFTDFVDRITF